MPQEIPHLPIRTGRTREQKEFYKLWLTSWQDKRPIDIENEFGYLFDYALSLFRNTQTESDLAKLESELLELQKTYPFTNWKDSGSFHYHAIRYRADSQIACKNYRQAIKILSEAYSLFIPARVETILSLKLYIGDDIEGQDLLFLLGVPKVTIWGRANWKLVVKVSNKLLDEKRKELGSAILPTWAKKSKLALENQNPPRNTSYTCELFGVVTKRFRTSIPYYLFTNVSLFSFSLGEVSRNIENIARENRGLPRIGEGWVSETELYYAMKDAFPKINVFQHASPEWLGRQHLDVYIPAKKIALEFQGKQHDEPIEFFGGKEGFLTTQKRDAKKMRLCEEHGVRLIYIRAGYSLEDVLREIKKRVS